jgi:hypothetical protein
MVIMVVEEVTIMVAVDAGVVVTIVVDAGVMVDGMVLASLMVSDGLCLVWLLLEQFLVLVLLPHHNLCPILFL